MIDNSRQADRGNLPVKICVIIKGIITFQRATTAPPMSAEQEHFPRMVRVTFGDVLGKLQQLFKEEFIRKCGMPYADDTDSGYVFLNNIHRKYTCKDVTVLANIQLGDVKAFDIITLSYCFLYSNALLLSLTSVQALTACGGL